MTTILSAISARLRRRSEPRGQALVELAIILPILLLLLLLTVDLGRVFYAQIGVVNASREGTAFAIVSTSNAGNAGGITSAVRREGGTTYTVSATCTPSPCVAGGQVEVRVDTTFDFLFPIVLDKFQLSNSATGVIQ